jgi:hypothetical protein
MRYSVVSIVICGLKFTHRMQELMTQEDATQLFDFLNLEHL